MGVSRARVFGGALVVVLAVGSALSACGDPKPELPDPTPPSSSSASVSPSESATPQPESAEDFIRRWVELSNEMQNTGETAEFERLGRDCDGCSRLIKLVRGYYAAGGFIKTDGLRVKSIEGAERGPRRPGYYIEADSAPTKYKKRAGGPLLTLPGGPVRYHLRLARSSSSWVVTEVLQVAQ